MTDLNQLNEAAKDYFDSLPTGIQEQIMQSGLEITSREDLEKFYQNFIASGACEDTKF